MARLEDRIVNNFIYYKTNYLALYAVMLIIAAYSSCCTILFKGFPFPFFLQLIFAYACFGCMICFYAVIFISRLPVIWVPHPFELFDFRITPSCIIAALGSFTLFTFVICRRYIIHFICFNLLFVLCKFFQFVAFLIILQYWAFTSYLETVV